MISAVEFDEISIKRLPYFFVFIVVLLLGLPMVMLMYGANFTALARQVSLSDHNIFLVESELRAYLRQVLLQWSAFSLSVVTVLLAFTQFKLAQDKIALIIGLSFLFSGLVQAMDILFVGDFSANKSVQDNLEAAIWTFSNLVSGLVILIGFSLILSSPHKTQGRLPNLVLLGCLLFSMALATIYFVARMNFLPNMWFYEASLSRPYELSYVFLYLFIALILYPSVYRVMPSILTNSVFYLSITQVVMGLYLMKVSKMPYDEGFYIGYFLKIVAYFIPFASLVINYVFSYRVVLKAQAVLEENQEKLRHIASHDALTQLYNRGAFEEFLKITIANYQRQNNHFSLLILDIDNFKFINDSLGHAYGDELLKQFSIRLKQAIRQGDIVARIGGDEFAIISSAIKLESETRHFSERLIALLKQPYLIHHQPFLSTVSLGIAIFPEDGDTARTLLQNADTAMYGAKKMGKNTYRFYTEFLTQTQRRESEIESFLRQAIQQQGLVLYFQPKYHLVSRQIVGAEVLLRMHHPVLGNISPAEFIPIAENNGTIVAIGEWVLEEACRWIQRWYERYQQFFSLSINISPLQLNHPSFFTKLSDLITTYQILPEYIDIEITETYLMLGQEQIQSVLKKIDELGINISLDDFGMGYSSLSRLKDLPIDTLKIDRYFIADIKEKEDKVVLVDLIIALAHEMQMNLVAEGIETETQLQYLIAHHCEIGQGFYLSVPLPEAEFEQLAFH